uniref:Uncharacterized protein TCIL3000_5_1520 n=1 Tax=Trypanosoma congolense (strain IL3000) TaxID=1068625 RepID=G0UMP1_TRYCI|nr:unnamed protein product [Trypanosoma congolense IL3000]
MVMDNRVPFKVTLHSGIFSYASAASIPMIITGGVTDDESQHRLEIHTPSHSGVVGMELSSIEFLVTGKIGTSSKGKQCSTLGGTMGYLFMQLLDEKGRPTGLPFPVASCNTLVRVGIISSVRLLLQADQRYRFYLVRRNITDDSVHSYLGGIVGVRFVGKLYFIEEKRPLRAKTKRQIEALTREELKFEADTDERILQVRRFNGDTPDTDLEAGSCRGKTGHKDSDEKVPNLLYAPFPGGCDES